jgi:hypothetical protein
MLIPFLPQTPFNHSYLAASATEDVIVADCLPVSGARSVNVSVRIHELSLSSGASFQFLVYGVNPSPTDGTVFSTTNTIGSTPTITTTNPNLVSLTTVISDPIYPFVRIVLRAQGPSGGANTTYGEFSADLVTREAVVADIVRELYSTLLHEGPGGAPSQGSGSPSMVATFGGGPAHLEFTRCNGIASFNYTKTNGVCCAPSNHGMVCAIKNASAATYAYCSKCC